MDQNRRNLLIVGAVLGAFAAGGLLPSACASRSGRKTPSAPTRSAPRRPAGEPEPMLEEDVAPVLDRLDAWYAANLPADGYIFNPPATAAQLAAFEQAVGMRMPSSYRQLYRWHDGENDDRRGHFYGLPLLSIQGAAAEWKA